MNFSTVQWRILFLLDTLIKSLSIFDTAVLVSLVVLGGLLALAFFLLIDKRRFRMLRTSDLSELGIIEFKLKPSHSVDYIYKDGKNYFASIYKGELENAVLERINDPRLQPAGAQAKPDGAAGSNQTDDFRVKTVTHYEGQTAKIMERVDSVLISRNHVRERINLHNIKDSISDVHLSPDGRFLLGERHFQAPAKDGLGRPDPHEKQWVSHFVVMEIER